MEAEFYLSVFLVIYGANYAFSRIPWNTFFHSDVTEDLVAYWCYTITTTSSYSGGISFTPGDLEFPRAYNASLTSVSLGSR